MIFLSLVLQLASMQMNVKTKDDQCGEPSFVVMSFQGQKKERTKEEQWLLPYLMARCFEQEACLAPPYPASEQRKTIQVIDLPPSLTLVFLLILRSLSFLEEQRRSLTGRETVC